MNLIEKKSDRIFILRIKVKINAKAQDVIIVNNYFQIKLTSKPIQNKANKELLKLLKKKLEVNLNQIHLISGQKSKNKLIQVTYDKKIDEKEILNKLLS